MVDVHSSSLTGVKPVTLFNFAASSGTRYNEAFATPENPRDIWCPILDALAQLEPHGLQQCQERITRMRHEDGSTYNPFDDPGKRGAAWALDMIPLLLGAKEWAMLEHGISQRACLLESILADIYGRQNLITSRRLPAELIYANKRFLRPCKDIEPNGNRFLTLYGIDVYRDASGQFKVLRDYGDSPAGLGYALENRIVISRVFAHLYQQTQLRRLAPFFQTMHRSSLDRAALKRKDPGIVLLSPGPDSHIYFEHALLSRYLGYPLVEGQDLTVRNGRVYLKKLAGLEPVEVLFRQITDRDSDPFALRRETLAGVAGLIQAARDKGVDIINPIGAGFIETPVLPVFLPDLCQFLRGEELILKNHHCWWSGTDEGRNHILAEAENLIISQAMIRAPYSAAGSLKAAIQQSPWGIIAREPVAPSIAPTWQNGQAIAQPTIFRFFACATEQGFTVMPGGLAITASNIDTLLGDSAELQQSKDIWVLSEQPVEPFSLMGSLHTVTELRRSSDLPSRVADNLLWLGRYLERAEGQIRLLRAVFRRMSGESRPQEVQELHFLLSLLQADSILPEDIHLSDSGAQGQTFVDHLAKTMYRFDHPESVVVALQRIRETSRNVRDRLSLDCWRAINQLEKFVDGPAGDPLELLNDTLFALNGFSGLAMESMTRGLGWRFMDMGRRIERALHMTGLIRVGMPQVCSESHAELEALLELADSIMTYRGRYRTTFQLGPALDLLIADEANPKSLAFQLSQLADHVAALPRQGERRYATAEERIALEMLTKVRLFDQSGVQCPVAGSDNEKLTGFLLTMESLLTEFAQQITAHYLSRVPVTPHFSMLVGARE